MSNKVYDILKYIACIVMPALATLILTLSGIWGFKYGEAIAGTVTALDVFLGAIIQVSSARYKAESTDVFAKMAKGVKELNELSRQIKEEQNTTEEPIE